MLIDTPSTLSYDNNSTSVSTTESALLARQPILGTKNNLFGYELLFRNSCENTANISNDVEATAVVLSNVLNRIGIKDILGEHLGFINVENNIIHSNFLTTLPPKKFIFEILEKTRLDENLLEAVKGLKKQGYTFALDDFTCTTENIDYFKPLFPYISILKVDITLNTGLQIKSARDLAHTLRMKLLAEKVETKEEYEYCKSLGFEYFQGYFFARPDIVTTRSIDPLLRNLFMLISLLRREAEIATIEIQFKRDPELTFNLLKFINSAALGIPNKITSVKQAVQMVGTKKLLNWLLLMVYSGTNSGKSRKPIFAYVALRAKLMSLLAASLKTDPVEGQRLSEEAFFIGMLSMFDSLLHAPLTKILPELNLPIEIYNAIFFKKGDLGILLASAIAAETGDLEKLMKYLSYLSLDIRKINELILRSTAWVNRSAANL